MKKQIYSEIIIDAPVAAVWTVLTDFGRYGEWNPLITRIEGLLEAGARLRVSLALDPGREFTFKPRLIRILARREICWIGRVGLAGIFDGEHSFHIESEGLDSTRFIHQETFSGVLVPFLWLYLKPRLETAYAGVNEGLKKQAEAVNDRMSQTT